MGQITKIAVAPAVLGIEYVLFRKTASLRVMASIALVCLGVAAATVTDEQVGTSGVGGLLVGAGAVGATALYQVLPVGHVPVQSAEYWTAQQLK